MYLQLVFLLTINAPFELQLPIKSAKIQLTQIGDFGIQRKARATIPAHLHTGIDIMRPSDNYESEPILAIAEGLVISIRNDGPYAQIIIEQHHNDYVFWTVYEHIADIQVDLYDEVKPKQQIARFFNRDELNKHGWQFDHFHFEVLKVAPQKLKPSYIHPKRYFNSYTLQCYSKRGLDKYFYNPLELLDASN